MPPDTGQLQQYLDNFKIRLSQELSRRGRLLAQELRGRLTNEHWLKPDAAQGNEVVFTLNLPIESHGEMTERRFSVNADCDCEVIADFIARATIQNLTLGEGKRRGQRIAIDGKCPMGLNVYWKV